MPYRITNNPEADGRVVLDQPFNPDKIQVTDRALALTQGAQLERNPSGGLSLIQFGNTSGLSGKQPEVDRNPYNFTALAGDKPWLNNSASNFDHEKWQPAALSGRIRFTATARTPIFVPEGFPFAEDSNDEAIHAEPRHFFRMPRTQGGHPHYAIPGASFKGVLRSAVEALTNDRFGAANRADYAMPLPYRRRSFQAGVIGQKSPDGSYQVLTATLVYLDVKEPVWITALPGGAIPPVLSYDKTYDRKDIALPGTAFSAPAADVRSFTANLLNRTPITGTGRPPGSHRWTHVIIERAGTITLPKAVVDSYLKNLKHDHYQRHHDRSSATYRPPLSPLPAVLKDLEDLSLGQIIFYTNFTKKTEIDSFGKNVNYLWPATHSIAGLCANYLRDPENKKTGHLGLEDQLGVAERLFGFLAPHRRENKDKKEKNSQPFRGKVRIETLWGPEAPQVPEADPQPNLHLAPLTAPAARAKSRPLYLEPANGTSASYSDAKPVLRGRKFYWHQPPNPTTSRQDIWEGHLAVKPNGRLKSGYSEVTKQLPPPIKPLGPGTVFEGCIHFDNITAYEVGALLYALAGDGVGGYDHSLKAGKGKPRGLGSLKVMIGGVDLLDLDPKKGYYTSLDKPSPNIKADRRSLVTAFKGWCESQVKFRTKVDTKFGDIPHIQDYVQLHTWPEDRGPRYYPINFADYGWLPADNRNPDEPRGGPRNPAMKTAR